MSSLRGATIAMLVLAALSAPAAAATGRAAVAPAPDSGEIHCLALAVYFEARGEPLAGKFAVGHVILNRTADPRFPSQICSVVKQGGDKQRNRCQFSFYCDGQSDKPTEKRAWREAMFVATLVAGGMIKDPTQGALWYHAEYVTPDWSQEFEPATRRQIGRHIFYTTTEPETRLAGRVCRPSSDWNWSV